MARMTVKKAARWLGVAEGNIRRRLGQGVFEGVQVPSPHGMMWLVELRDDAPPDQNEVIEKDPADRKALRAQPKSYRSRRIC